MEFWKIIPVFAQEKEFVIKLLKILNWVNSSCSSYYVFGSSREATGRIKKNVLRKIF